MGVNNQLLSRHQQSSTIINMSAEVPWETINEKLPFARNKDAFSQRKEMWTAMDINGNGYLSLAEVTKGVRDVIAVDELFDAIPAINRSFHHVKAVSKAENSHGDDFIQFSEFRLFLQTLRQFFEYFQAFNRLDTGEDQRVDKEEFTSDKMEEVRSSSLSLLTGLWRRILTLKTTLSQKTEYIRRKNSFKSCVMMSIN